MFFFLGFEIGSLQFVLLGVTEEFTLQSTMLGVLLATQFFALMIGQPVFGLIADRIGKKPIILAAMCIFITGCSLMTGSSVVTVFAAGVFLAGLGYGVAESLACASLIDVYKEKSERYINLSQSLFSLGAVAGPIAANQLSSIANSRMIFLVSAIGFTALLPMFCIIPLPDSRSIKDKPTFSLRGGAAIPFLFLLMSIFTYGGMETAAAGFFNSLFTIALPAPQFGAYAVSLYWLGIAVSRVLFGLIHIPARRVVIGCMLICMAMFVALGISHAPVISLLLCAAAGVAAGPVWGMLVSFAAKEFPAFSGTAVSLMSTFSGLGATLVPIAVGWTADYFNLFWSMIAIGAVVLLGVAGFIGYVKKRSD